MKRSTVVSLSCAAALVAGVAATAPAWAAVKTLDGQTYAPFQPTGSVSYPQGIKRADDKGTFYIVGTINASDGSVYEGPVDEGATGTWTTMNVPDSWATSATPLNTSIYGVDNLSGDQTALVGSWAEGDLLGAGNQSFYYEGPVTATPDPLRFKQVQAVNNDGDPAQFTFLHSVSGGLVVGNWDMARDNNPAGHAFIYDPRSEEQIPIQYPKNERSYTHTAYGIWYNGGHSYTIAGGATQNKRVRDGRIFEPLGDGTLIDYNSRSGRFSNFTRFSYPGQIKGKTVVTHFEGIWSNGTGKYRLPATASTNVGGSAAVVTVRRQKDGSWGTAKWERIAVTGAKYLSTNDSVYGKVSVGIFQTGGDIDSYAFRAD